MGCGASGGGGDGGGRGVEAANKRRELKLPAAGLVFTQEQLLNLNGYFSQLIDTSRDEDRDPRLEGSLVLIERLVQRLVVGVGLLDSRFASKFLVNLQPHRLTNKSGTSLSYLVRLDELSSPCSQLEPGEGQDEEEVCSCQLVETGCGGGSLPGGYARLRLLGSGAARWAEFLAESGYLRRDKVQERFVELLAQSAARSHLLTTATECDESRLSGVPGKVIDASHLHRILQLPPSRQIYYGTGESQKKFPDPRDFRIAIVEGSSCVRLRVDTAAGADLGVETDIEVRLVLGVGFPGWPNSAQFPARISLCHPECLLYHQAASTGFYAVPAPPQPRSRCEERSTLWQLRSPSAEETLLKHHSRVSLPSRVLAVLRCLSSQIRRTSSGGHVISDYIIKTLLWYRLEESSRLEEWSGGMLSRQVLIIADRLITALRTQRAPSYFFQRFNVMLNCPGGGTLHYSEEDYSHDAELLSYTLRQLGAGVSSPGGGGLDTWSRLETALVTRWLSTVASLAPPPPTRGVRFSFTTFSTSGYSRVAASQYSVRQLNYIGLLLRSMLTVKSLTLTKGSGLPGGGGGYIDGTASSSTKSESTTEDLVFLVSSILEQAKAAFLRSPQATGKKAVSAQFDRAATHLLDEIRDVGWSADHSDDSSVVREVLRWLYWALDHGPRRPLAVVLRPYLSDLFLASHENSWFAPEWSARQGTVADELAALGEFSSLLVAGKISPIQGILDAQAKGWSWAEKILETSGQLADPLELVLSPSLGRVLRLRASGGQLATARSLSKARGKATLPRKYPTMRECLKSRLGSVRRSGYEEELLTTSHSILREASPLSQVLEGSHRYGAHRGLGSIVQAFIALKKFSVLQEVVCLLPEKERARALEEIEGVRRGRPSRPRQTAATLRCGTTPGDSSGTTPPGLLLGTCRSLRTTSQHHQLSVFNPAFFSAPDSRDACPPRAFSTKSRRGGDATWGRGGLGTAEMSYIDRGTRLWHHQQRRSNDITTQL